MKKGKVIILMLVCLTLCVAFLNPVLSTSIKKQPPRPPVARFFWTPEDPDVGDIITFNASQSNAFHEYKIIAYEWDLNGDSKCDDACGIVTCHCFQQQKVCSITLKVTDDHDQSGQITKTIDLRNPPATPTITGEQSVKKGKPYTVHMRTTDPDQNKVYYMIDWGAEKSSWLGPFESGDTITRNHTFTYQGNITIKVKSKDSTNAESDWGQLTISIPHQETRVMNPFHHLFEKLRTFLFHRFFNIF